MDVEGLVLLWNRFKEFKRKIYISILMVLLFFIQEKKAKKKYISNTIGDIEIQTMKCLMVFFLSSVPFRKASLVFVTHQKFIFPTSSFHKAHTSIFFFLKFCFLSCFSQKAQKAKNPRNEWMKREKKEKKILCCDNAVGIWW